ncbi:tRNA threonylcarbamoyladenosine dehydratase [Lentisphaera profundi]|uniref:tRNA threonylcarbamoyladenosine dehydratase n=1 Tax=Lentisphaera profundi TaxID=1658616 RepID=A0ABY7VMR2_9BACT|nr:tRNA threonylcarbamoyladenosine dehydratase [Lentisphaera profundi]WDE95328.1 tRNA threonylcarbamoyladenosine dehydratase [Lentisphaera profundi]
MELEIGSFEHRFSGIQRLYGKTNAEVLRKAHILVVGVGGVGCWAVEALARAGIGQLTLVDWDDVCFSNSNRQIQAMTGMAGRAKVEILKERIALINPECQVHAVRDFYTAENANEIFTHDFDFVVDAIDSLGPKCHLIAECRDRGIGMVVSGSAGGRLDPSRIEVEDLSRTKYDALIARVRKKLRADYGFTRYEGKKFKVEVVYTQEVPVLPENCEVGEGDSRNLDCRTGYGTATFMTGVIGFIMAERAVAGILNKVKGS